MFFLDVSVNVCLVLCRRKVRGGSNSKASSSSCLLSLQIQKLLSGVKSPYALSHAYIMERLVPRSTITLLRSPNSINLFNRGRKRLTRL